MNQYDVMKQTWRTLLVGTPEELQNGDAAVQARMAACGKAAQESWDKLRANKREDAPALFRGAPLGETFDMTLEYGELRKLALGWATYGSPLYQNEDLLADILWAMDWMYRHFYGRDVMEDRGWRDWRLFNWWDWKIGSPRYLMDAMVLVDDYLTLEQKREYLALFDMVVPAPFDYAANKVNFGRLISSSGILTERPERILCGRDGIEDTYMYADGWVNDGQGFYRDGSYIFHTRHPMNGVYGREHFESAIRYTAMLNGSDFAMKPERVDVIYTWLYKTFLPFYRFGSYMRVVDGRAPGNEVPGGYGFLANLVQLYDLSTPEKKGEIAALLQELVKEHPMFHNENCNDFFDHLTLHEYVTYRRAMAEKTGAAVQNRGSYVFNNMERVVQHNEKSAFALGISSSRIYNYECINHRNMNGWYHGDGMLNCYADPFQYDAAYWEKVDSYRIPGTTVDNREREEVTIAQANEYLSAQDFVGGLSAGETGLAAMQLESYHSDGKLISTRFYAPTGEYGGPPPARECTLMAKKSYFFMKDYAVCLGADIHAEDNAPVYTVVENRKDAYVFENGAITGTQAATVLVNGEEAALTGEDKAFAAVRSVTLGDLSCCTFAPQELTLCRKGDFTQVLWQHGVNPQNESYAYAVLPHAGAAEAAAFCENCPVEIVANTAEVQMVKEGENRYGVFWQAGECGGIAVSAPLLVCAANGELRVCDPARKVTTVTVTADGKEYAFDLTGADGAARTVKL